MSTDSNLLLYLQNVRECICKQYPAKVVQYADNLFLVGGHLIRPVLAGKEAAPEDLFSITAIYGYAESTLFFA